ncbi:hypothetical protein PLESTF_000889400 [Pleodorina starrii]|nr:hypothetical protein PLESTF_000889400 [Pleodorina starrii]
MLIILYEHVSERFQHPPYLAWAASLLWYLQICSYIGVSMRIQPGNGVPCQHQLQQHIAAERLHEVRPSPGAAVGVGTGAERGAAAGPPGVDLDRWDLYSNGHGGRGVQDVPAEVQDDVGDGDEGTGRVDGVGVDNLQRTVKAILSNIRGTPAYWANTASDLFTMLCYLGPPPGS